MQKSSSTQAWGSHSERFSFTIKNHNFTLHSKIRRITWKVSHKSKVRDAMDKSLKWLTFFRHNISLTQLYYSCSVQNIMWLLLYKEIIYFKSWATYYLLRAYEWDKVIEVATTYSRVISCLIYSFIVYYCMSIGTCTVPENKKISLTSYLIFTCKVI